MLDSLTLSKLQSIASQTSDNDEIVTLAKAILDIEQRMAALYQTDVEMQREVNRLKRR